MENLAKFWIYIIYALFPAYYFFLAIIQVLEKTNKNRKVSEPYHNVKQTVFLTICVLVTFVIDKYFGDAILNIIPVLGVPRICMQIVLFPLILMLFAKLVGGTTPPSLKKGK